MNRHDQSGFTFFEIIVVLGIIGLLAAFASPLLRQEINELRQDSSASELLTLQDAAVFFYGNNSNTWPDAANNCAGALNTLIAQGYVLGIDANSPWNTNYSFDCTGGRIMDISLPTDGAQFAQELDAKMGAATTAGATVTVHVGPPSSTVALDGVLHRFNDPARPELNRMQTDVDMANFSVNAADRVTQNDAIWSDSWLRDDEGGAIELNEFGDATVRTPYIDFHRSSADGDYNVRLINSADGLMQMIGAVGFQVVGDMGTTGDLTVIGTSLFHQPIRTLTDATVERDLIVNGDTFVNDILLRDIDRLSTQGVYDVGIVPSQTTITKPGCNSLTPQIFTSGSYFSSGANSKPMATAETWAENLSATTWRVRGRVLTEDGYQEPVDINRLRIQVIVKCT